MSASSEIRDGSGHTSPTYRMALECDLILLLLPYKPSTSRPFSVEAIETLSNVSSTQN
jgi:hypothetical protein